MHGHMVIVSMWYGVVNVVNRSTLSHRCATVWCHTVCS